MSESETSNGPILALDLATVSGVAEGFLNQIPSSFHLRFAPAKSPSDAVMAEAMAWLDARIKSQARMGAPHRLIVVEEAVAPSFLARQGKTNRATTELLMGLRAIALTAARMNGVPARTVKVEQIRRLLIGSNPPGQMGKKLVRERVRQFGWIGSDEAKDLNATDALGVFAWAHEHLIPGSIRAKTFRPLPSVA